MSEENFWFIFDGYGHSVFYTNNEIHANFDAMAEDEYNIPKCIMFKNPVDDQGILITEMDGVNDLEYSAETEKISRVIRDRKYSNPYRVDGRHVPKE